jgi:hypothetical protein
LVTSRKPFWNQRRAGQESRNIQSGMKKRGYHKGSQDLWTCLLPHLNIILTAKAIKIATRFCFPLVRCKWSSDLSSNWAMSIEENCPNKFLRDNQYKDVHPSV